MVRHPHRKPALDGGEGTRPKVTIAQNTVRAIAAYVVEAPRRLVMSSWDQLPFTVSHTP